MQKICAYSECDNKFVPSNGNQIYCSRRCNRRQWRLNNLQKEVKKERICACENCKNLFIPGRSDQIYCSKKCVKKQCRLVIYEEKICASENCEESFTPSRKDQIYCSKKCRRKKSDKKWRKQYILNNPEKEKERLRKYRENNPEKTKASKRKWRKNNFEKEKEIGKNYRKNNPEIVKSYVYKRRSKLKELKSIPSGFVEEQLIKQDYICGNLFCKIDLRTLLESEVTIEHLQPITRKGNNDPKNLRVWCRSCNSSKNDKTIEEYYFWKISS